jgi:Domain of unknown function (DUF6265)
VFQGVGAGDGARALDDGLRRFDDRNEPDGGEGKSVFFEYLRIESRGSDIYYVAHPKARTPGTDFKLTRLTRQEAVFENPAHDFPKRIIYRKSGDGKLSARIEGDGTEKENRRISTIAVSRGPIDPVVFIS